MKAISSPSLGFLNTKFVNVTGDTMTGILDMGNNKIILNTGFEMSASGLLLLETPANTNIYFGGTSGDYLSFNTATSPHAFYPGTNGSFNLGRSNFFWLNAYTTNLYVNTTAFLNGGTAGTIKVDGNLLIEPATDSTTAVNITKADTTTVFNVDTTNARVGIGTTPTARLHLPASAAGANLASLKIDAGTVATTPVTGNIESDGTHLYWTDSGGTRRQLDNA